MQTIQSLITQLMQNESEHIYQQILQALRHQDTIWAAYSPVTRNFFTGMEHGEAAAYLFSEEAFFTQFQDTMIQQNIDVKAVENKAENRMLLFGDLLRSGFTVLIIDNGQRHVCVGLFELLDELEGNDPENPESIIMNPHLLARADLLYQNIACRRANTVDEVAMFREIYKGRYLMPVRIDGSNAIVPAIKTRDGKQAIPFFTDWAELRRYDKSGELRVRTAKFDDIAAFCEKADAIVINPFGVSIFLDAQMLQTIREVSQGTFQLPPRMITMENQQQIKITSPDKDSEEMTKVVAESLKEKKEVNAAYLLQMTKPSAMRPNYLFIIDTKGDCKSLYDEIAEVAMPHANGLDIDFVSYQEKFGREAADRIKPFYKKKRFRLF